MAKRTILCMGLAVACVLTSVYTLTGCKSHEGSEEQLRADVDSFATYYFNWQFPKAEKYCDDLSRFELEFAASNVSQADVEKLRNKKEDATVEVTGISFDESGISASAYVTVRNFLWMGQIGMESQMVEERQFYLPLVFEDNAWKIRMVSQLQNERRSRDRVWEIR